MTTSVSDLTEDVLTTIFSFMCSVHVCVGIKDKSNPLPEFFHNVAFVSKMFYESSHTFILNTKFSVYLEGYHLHRCKLHALTWLASRCPKLETLIIRPSDELARRYCIHLLDSCNLGNLCTIGIDYCSNAWTWTDDEERQAIENGYPLEVMERKPITNHDFQELVTNTLVNRAPRLKELFMEVLLKEDWYFSFINNLADKIINLRLHFDDQDWDDDSKSLDEKAIRLNECIAHMVHLKQLEIHNYCDAGLIPLCIKSDALEYLDIINGHIYQDGVSECICPSLKKLSTDGIGPANRIIVPDSCVIEMKHFS